MSIEAINWVFKQDDLHNSGAKFVLTVLANYSDEDGRCYPSQETLAAKTSMTDRSVRNHLDWLEDHGYITAVNRQKAGEFVNNLYQLEFKKEKKPSVPMSRKRGVPAENISAEESAPPENISDDKTEADRRKTFPTSPENISAYTSALKEDTKGGGGLKPGDNGNLNVNGKPPATAAGSAPNDSEESLDDFFIRMQIKFQRLDVKQQFREFKKTILPGTAPPGIVDRTAFEKHLVLADYLRRKQFEFPGHDVPAIWRDFYEKCGSAKYPHLRPTERHFDKWLAEQDENLAVATIGGGGGEYVNPMTGRGLK